MQFVEENYSEFIQNDMNDLHKLTFDFSIKDRYIKVYDENNNKFKFQTPLLRVLKPIHVTYNKKKQLQINILFFN